MTIDDILKLSPDKIYSKLTKKDTPKVDFETLKKQYDPTQHDVFDETKRPKKKIRKDNGRKDKYGNPVLDTGFEEVNRIAVPFQYIITERAVGFLLGNPVEVKPYLEENNQSQQTLFDMIQKTLDDNKSAYFDRKLARILFKETEAAELWYLEPAPDGYWNNGKSKFRLKVKLLAQSLGDLLYPHFDEYGDMDAFSREYRLLENDTYVTYFDTYTPDFNYHFTKKDGNLSLLDFEVNDAKKIPVIYYKQDYPEWYFVQSMIDRYEKLKSNFADTDDYFGSPMIKVSGNVQGLSSKGEQGKILQLDKDASADYMSWDSAPDAIKTEADDLKELIYSMSQTPDISFSQMKSIGNVTGIALKLMFMDAHMKTANKEEIFGEMFQRRYNLIKAFIGNVIDLSLVDASKTLSIDPVFTPYMPKNTKEIIDTLFEASGNQKIMSIRTTLENNPYVGDVDTEVQRMQEESQQELSLQQQETSGSFSM